jgi:hypothetical protein
MRIPEAHGMPTDSGLNRNVARKWWRLLPPQTPTHSAETASAKSPNPSHQIQIYKSANLKIREQTHESAKSPNPQIRVFWMVLDGFSI